MTTHSLNLSRSAHQSASHQHRQPALQTQFLSS
jgi:hypothetical protein